MEGPSTFAQSVAVASGSCDAASRTTVARRGPSRWLLPSTSSAWVSSTVRAVEDTLQRSGRADASSEVQCMEHYLAPARTIGQFKSACIRRDSSSRSGPLHCDLGCFLREVQEPVPPRSTGLPFQVERLGAEIPSNSDADASVHFGAHSVSRQALRGHSRYEEAICLGSQTPRPMGVRPQHAPLCQGRASGAAVESAGQHSSKQSNRCRKQVAQARLRPKALLERIMRNDGPHNSRRRQMSLELGGNGSIAKAFRHKGALAMHWPLHHPNFDITEPRIGRKLRGWVLAGQIEAVIMHLPVETFSGTPKGVSLRDPTNPWEPHAVTTQEEKGRVRRASMLLSKLLSVATVCQRMSVPVLLTSHASSTVWRIPEVQLLM
eukprot:3872754-Amphidinium_carterae.1